MEDRCVMCGEVIPEGRMVCPSCENNVLKQELGEEIGTTNATTQLHAKYTMVHFKRWKRRHIILDKK